MSGEVFNWVTMIEVPVFLALFRMIARVKKDNGDGLFEVRGEQERNIASCREALSEFKIHVARNYVSVGYLKDVETRLTSHLLRIEKKLEDVGRNR